MTSFWKGTFVPFKKYVVGVAYGDKAVDDDGNIYIEVDITFGRGWGEGTYTYYLLEDFVPEEDRREYFDEAGFTEYDPSIRVIESLEDSYSQSIYNKKTS